MAHVDLDLCWITGPSIPLQEATAHHRLQLQITTGTPLLKAVDQAKNVAPTEPSKTC